MFKLICVTARRLCGEDLIRRIGRLAAAGVDEIILREKDLGEGEYLELARRALAACRGTGTVCTLHTFAGAAKSLGADRLHMPLPALQAQSGLRRDFAVLGTSVHSPEQAHDAWTLGADYVAAGHIFPTASKPGLPARGLAFLEEICRESPGPVYAIGGIGEHNIGQVRAAGAAGACVMSALMDCGDPERRVRALREAAGL